jgi:hypothetical protein
MTRTANLPAPLAQTGRDMDGETDDNERNHVRTRRRCLRCDTIFDSAWAGERICRPCKGTSAWRSGQPAPIFSSRTTGTPGK